MKFLKNILANVTHGAIATAGGCASRVIENKLSPMVPFLKDYPKFHGALPYLVGAGIADMKAMHYAGIGMMAVAGTDAAGKFVPMLSTTGTSVDISDDVADELADKLAATLEANLADDIADTVYNERGAMNDEVGAQSDAMNAI